MKSSFASSGRTSLQNMTEDELRSLVRWSPAQCDAAERELRRRGTSSDWQREHGRRLQVQER
jgi:hypothetical protein